MSSAWGILDRFVLDFHLIPYAHGPMDKRKSTRVSLKTKAEISKGCGSIAGDVRDLSLSGMYMRTPDRCEPGTTVEITLQLGGPEKNLHIPLKGIIRRNDATGLAVQFRQLELDGIITLRNIMIYAQQEMEKFFKREREQRPAKGNHAPA